MKLLAIGFVLGFLLSVVFVDAYYKYRTHLPEIGITANVPDVPRVVKTAEPSYNTAKDERVNRIFRGRLLAKDKYYSNLDYSTNYSFRFHEAVFIVTKYDYVPYKSKAHWEYCAMGRDGILLLITGDYWEHRVSPRTIEKLKNMCLNYKDL
jgi:hypothetical protein